MGVCGSMGVREDGDLGVGGMGNGYVWVWVEWGMVVCECGSGGK